MAAFVKIGDATFPMSDAAGVGLHRFLVEERRAYDSLEQDCEQQLAEMHERHTADTKAAEDLLAEAQKRIEQLAAAEERASHFAGEALRQGELHTRWHAKAKVAEAKLESQPHYWFHWWASAIFGGCLIASLVAHAVR